MADAREAREAVELASWVRFLRAHSAVTRALSADLERGHGLTINDYEVLLRLSRAPERMMRRVDLAQSVLLTASGITRLLDGLERGGHVEKVRSQEDARVSYARLTDAGFELLRAAARTHLEGVDRLFLERFDERERALLAELLARLPGNGDDVPPGACGPE